jgi:ClpP class serine protease
MWSRPGFIDESRLALQSLNAISKDMQVKGAYLRLNTPG